ncbi:hypothetical protein K804_22935 [Salmonella enterica subsp. enterica serovar Newport str. SHSN014]|nr:hypothetical protein G207_02589 [Salmonella enterica subsp. enterica serovar Newport str. Shandong_3]OSJ39570.1 hypothetical protein K804_22935 [Salmonella enterica subsp. enterica serovar Newport str. SHSN014]OSK06857.1 hypothetical protein K802_05848 [Salmonella enterica subsp. enterica serovar Newport str. SHSN012]
MPGATLKYELITDELCLTAASVGGECECKTLAFPSEMPWALADTLRDDFILD